MDFRIANENHIELIKNKVNELALKYNCNAKIFDCIPSFIDKTYVKENQKTANFLTEASMVKGSSRIILGPGPVTAHEINEHITVESYEAVVEQYVNIIKEVCSK